MAEAQRIADSDTGEPNPPPQATGGDPMAAAGAALDTTRSAGVSAFEGILGELRSVRASATAMTDVLKRLGDDCQTAAGADDRLAEFSDAISALQSAARDIVAHVGSDDIRAASDGARRSFERLHGLSLQFWSISILTRVTIGRLGERSLDQYVDVVQDLSGRLKGIIQTALASLTAIETSLEDMRRSVEKGAKVVGDLHKTIRDLLADAGDNSALSEVSREFSSTSDAMTAQVKSALGQLVSQLQFSDAFSQRLEHAIDILDIAEIHARDRAALSAAQIAAIGTDQVAAQADIDAALGTLVSTVERGLSVFSEGLGGATTAAIDERRAMIQTATGAGSRIETHIGTAEQVIERTRATFESATSDFAALRETIAETSTSAINVNILVHGQSESFAPLRILANEARAMAIDMTAIVAQFEGHLAVLEALFSEDPFAPLRAALGAFDAARLSCDETLSVVDRIDGTRSEFAERATELDASVMAARSSLDHAGATLDALSDQQDALAVLAAGAPLNSSAATAALLDVYTMESERDVHRALFPDDATTQETAAGEGGESADPLDDFEMF